MLSEPFHDSQRYARLLSPRLHGYPLWRPESSTEYRSEGVSIGDVGLLTADGGFDCLFNICYPKEHPVNHQGVPEDFDPLDLNLLELDSCDPFFNPYTDITTRSINRVSGEAAFNSLGFGGGLEFQSIGSEGAVLALPNGGSRTDLRNKQPFFLKAHQNASKWYNFARTARGSLISDDALYLVTGCDKCRSWGVAALSNPSYSTSLKLVSDGSARYYWEKPDFVSGRSGPATPPTEPNQCVFLRGYRISVRQDAVGYGDDKSSLDSTYLVPTPEQDAFTASLPRKGYFPDQFSQAPRPHHPLTAINTFLLNTTGCTTAVTHDDNWISSLRSPSELVDSIVQDNDLLNRVMAFHKVFMVGDTVSLEMAGNHDFLPQTLYPAHVLQPPTAPRNLTPHTTSLPPSRTNKEQQNSKPNAATCLSCASRKVPCPPPKGSAVDCANCQRLQIACKWREETPSNVSRETDSRDLRLSRRSVVKEKAIDSPYKSSLKGKGPVRTSSGCFTCRIRKKKCDGGSQRVNGQNSCATCARLHIECLALGGDRPEWLKDKDKVDDVRQRIKVFLSAQGKIIGLASSPIHPEGDVNITTGFLRLSENDDIAFDPQPQSIPKVPTPPVPTPVPTPVLSLPVRDEQLEIWDSAYYKPFDSYGGVYEDPMQPHHDLYLPSTQAEQVYYWP